MRKRLAQKVQTFYVRVITGKGKDRRENHYSFANRGLALNFMAIARTRNYVRHVDMDDKGLIVYNSAALAFEEMHKMEG